VTEEEWLAADDPGPLLVFMYRGAGGLRWLTCHCCLAACRRHGRACPTYRKLRLFAVACCRHLSGGPPDPVCLAALRHLEDFLEGQADEDRRDRYADEIKRKAPRFEQPGRDAWMAFYGAVHRRWRQAYDYARPEDRWLYAVAVARHAAVAAEAGEVRVQSSLLRDIFGNPFRPVDLDPAWLTWHGGAAVKLAWAVYEERELPSGHLAATRLAVLADMLEESGCCDARLLGHLRGPEPHVRGCFAVDALLGKS
jgi:hypothetical protein